MLLTTIGHHTDLHPFPTRRSSDLLDDDTGIGPAGDTSIGDDRQGLTDQWGQSERARQPRERRARGVLGAHKIGDRKSTRLNSSHLGISYAVFCLKKKT